MRTLTLVVAATLFAPGINAGPLDWAKHHKRFLLMEGAAITGAGIHAYGLHHCRRGGVERCDEHYGAAWAMYGITTGLTVIALPAVAEGCWKQDGGKVCWGLAYGGSIGQGAWGIHEALIPPQRDMHDLKLRNSP